MDKSLIAALLLFPLVALGQTHTFPGNNVFPSTSTTDFNSGATVDFTGATVTGLPAGGAATWGTITGTLSSQTDLQTALNAKQAADADLDAWALKTPYAGALTITTGQTLNVTTGGTLGTAAYTASTAYEVPLTFSTGLTRSTNTVTVNTAQNITRLSNLTTNGFVKTETSNGSLTVDTSTYQVSDTDLTTWAGITPVAAVGTWIATPNSANLRSALTDENGTGALLFSGATTPDFTTGFTIGAAAASGKIPIGNGTNYVPSTPTYPNAAGAVGYLIRSDGTNFTSYPNQQTNSSVTNQAVSTSDIYLPGSSCVVTAGDFKAKGQYRCVFDMVKTAGTGSIVISVRIGTAGTTSDTAQLTFTFGAGTSVADSGIFDVVVNWRTVGGGSSAVVQGICRGTHNLATTGLFNNAAGWVLIGTPSGGFNSTAATTIGISFNGSTAFSGTNSLVQAQLQQ